MEPDHVEIITRLLGSLLIGALIGMERSYTGRAAGFRTHTLVCLASTLLMLMTAFGERWIDDEVAARVVLDPTRMAQGIMTGIGFLGAGAILKAGFSIHGLTTAASIWTTAALGILVGVGFYMPAIAGAAITLGVLTLFRWIEARIPVIYYAQCTIRYGRAGAPDEAAVRALVTRHGFRLTNLNYHLDSTNDYFEYRLVIHSKRIANASKLAQALRESPDVREFRLSPTVD